MKLLSNNSKSPDIITNTIYFPLCNLFYAKEATFLPISHLRPHKTFSKQLTLFCCSQMPFLLTDAIFLIIHLSPQLPQLLPNKEPGGKKCPLSAVSLPHFPQFSPFAPP